MSEEVKLLISPHTDAARVVLEKILALSAELPRFNLVKGNVQSLNGNMVPDAFMESASVGIQRWSRLQIAGGVDAATLRDSYGYAMSYEPVVAEIFALARAFQKSVRAQRSKAAKAALDVY